MHNLSPALNIKPPLPSYRFPSIDKYASVLSDIYQEEVNIAIWQNDLSDQVIENINSIMHSNQRLAVVMTSTPSQVVDNLIECSPELRDKIPLCEHIALLAEMFCSLFELKRVGLRLTTLDRAMCPRFHVDKIPCRLVSTFAGTATEWLPHDKINRSKLGPGSKGKPDEISGLIQHANDIQQMQIGDVALLKGDAWFNNEGNGAVHRSPEICNNNKRLLLTLDFME